MAEVSGIGGADFSVTKGAFSPDENSRLNRPVREDARPEDNATSPVRSNEAQANQRSTQPSQTTNDGDAQQNAANTGDFTAGGTDRRDDTVFISPEARNVARAEANAAPAAAPTPGAPAVAESPDAPRGAEGVRATATRPPEPERQGPAPTDGAAARPAAAAAADAAEPAPAEETNQRVRNENTNAEVNGSEADQSEQSRTIGQVIDVFA